MFILVNKLLLLRFLKKYFFYISDEQVLQCTAPHEHLSENCCEPGCIPGLICHCVKLPAPLVCHCDKGYTRDPITHECKECLK